MVAKLLPPLGAIVALLLAGCGGSQSASSTTRQSATKAAQSGAPAQSAVPARSTAPARRAITKKMQGKPLGRHTSRAPVVLKDDQGPGQHAHALPPHTYRVTLTGKSVRAGAVNGMDVGMVTLLPETRQVCWRFGRLPKVSVRTAAFGRVQMVLRPESASIRAGAKGANGPVVVALHGRYVPTGCTAAAPVVLNSILAAPRFYYVSLGSATSPGGALRAQL